MSLAGGRQSIDEVRSQNTFLLSTHGTFTSSVFFPGITYSGPCINCRLSCILDEPGILILEKCTLISSQVAYSFLSIISELRISILFCMDEFPPDLTGLLIIHQFTVFHKVSPEFCHSLSHVTGINILTDIDQIVSQTFLSFRPVAPDGRGRSGIEYDQRCVGYQKATAVRWLKS
jgi:hypothetical protein